jgi:NTE family protein
MKRLHDHRQSGRLKGFLLAHLGQQDDKLPLPLPSDFITRDQVVGYPTNFRAMKPEIIRRLSARGEQLTCLLLQHYLPDL